MCIPSDIGVRGGDYSKEAVDRGTAIIRGNAVSLFQNFL